MVRTDPQTSVTHPLRIGDVRLFLCPSLRNVDCERVVVVPDQDAVRGGPRPCRRSCRHGSRRVGGTHRRSWDRRGWADRIQIRLPDPHVARDDPADFPGLGLQLQKRPSGTASRTRQHADLKPGFKLPAGVVECRRYRTLQHILEFAFAFHPRGRWRRPGRHHGRLCEPQAQTTGDDCDQDPADKVPDATPTRLRHCGTAR